MISVINAIHSDGRTGGTWCNACISIATLHCTDIHLRVSIDISKLTTTIYIARDIGTLCFSLIQTIFSLDIGNTF